MGPGWVSWRRSDDYYGWAPLEPGTRLFTIPVRTDVMTDWRKTILNSTRVPGKQLVI